MLMAFLNVEPFTTMFPEAGPNGHLFMRKIRKVFDPNGVASPGRQVFTEEEWQQFPKEFKDMFNQMRATAGTGSSGITGADDRQCRAVRRDEKANAP